LQKEQLPLKIVDVRWQRALHETGGSECAKQGGLQFSENKNKRVQ
jgi:hypothetical protein